MPQLREHPRAPEQLSEHVLKIRRVLRVPEGLRRMGRAVALKPTEWDRTGVTAVTRHEPISTSPHGAEPCGLTTCSQPGYTY